MHTNLNLLKHSPDVDLTDREFGLGELNGTAAKAAADVVTYILQNEPPQLSLNYVWGAEDGIGGPPVTDPLSIDVALPFAGDGCVYLRGSLRELFKDMREHLNGTFDDDDAAQIRKLAAALREEADLLDKHAEGIT